MKTIKYISVFVVLILSFNCSKSDDNSEKIQGDFEALILGEWKIASKTLNGETLELNCENGISDILQFNDVEVTFTLDYEDGNDCVDLVHSANYMIIEDTIVVSGAFIESNWIIITLNATTFSFSFMLDEQTTITETHNRI